MVLYAVLHLTASPARVGDQSLRAAQVDVDEPYVKAGGTNTIKIVRSQSIDTPEAAWCWVRLST